MTWEDIMKNNANSKNKQEFVDEVVRNAERILDKYTKEYSIDGSKFENELLDVLRKLFDDLVQVNNMTWKDEIKKDKQFTREDYLMYKQWVNRTIIQLNKMNYKTNLPTILWRGTNKHIEEMEQKLKDMLEGATRMYHNDGIED